MVCCQAHRPSGAASTHTHTQACILQLCLTSHTKPLTRTCYMLLVLNIAGPHCCHCPPFRQYVLLTVTGEETHFMATRAGMVISLSHDWWEISALVTTDVLQCVMLIQLQCRLCLGMYPAAGACALPSTTLCLYGGTSRCLCTRPCRASSFPLSLQSAHIPVIVGLLTCRYLSICT